MITGVKRECKNAKWLSEEALQKAVKRREVKGKGEKERYTQLNAEFQRTARRDKTAFLSQQCKETEKSNRMGKTRGPFKKIGGTKGIFHAKMGSIKDRKGKDLTEAEEIKKRWEEYRLSHQERSSRGENGNLLQYSCLENPMDRGAWQVIIQRVAVSDTTEAT